MRCLHCRRVIRNSEVRDRYYPWSADEGGSHVVPGGGCLWCVGDEDDDERESDARVDAALDRMRDGDAA